MDTGIQNRCVLFNHDISNISYSRQQRATGKDYNYSFFLVSFQNGQSLRLIPDNMWLIMTNNILSFQNYPYSGQFLITFIFIYHFNSAVSCPKLQFIQHGSCCQVLHQPLFHSGRSSSAQQGPPISEPIGARLMTIKPLWETADVSGLLLQLAKTNSSLCHSLFTVQLAT